MFKRGIISKPGWCAAVVAAVWWRPMAIVSVLLALLAGALQPVQAAINALLGKQIGNPVFSVCVSGLLSGTVLGVCLLFTRSVLPKGAAAALSLPWWMWMGGVIGAAYLVAVVIATPKLGTGTTMAMVIAVQVAVSVALDHFAVLGLDRHPFSVGRAAGVGLFVVGAFLIQKF